jgi:sugar/nucleoside kinase (ribokinase family)
VRLPFRIPARETARFDVVGLGLNSIDLVAVVASYPPPNSKQRLERFERLPGGQIATALVVCAHLGWRCSYLGSFGADDLGTFARENLVRAGVAVDAARTIAGATNQFAVVIVDSASGERTVLWNRHPGLAIDAGSVSARDATAGRVLVVDCHETAAAAAAAAYARAAGVPTIVDVEKVRPGIDNLLRHIDAIVAAEEFPCAYTGYDSPGRALEALEHEFKAPLVCVTLGAEGSLARCGGREIRTPAFRVECVDSTGAGDAFRGGFAAGCLRAPDGEVEDVLRYANAVAALNCRALGAQGGVPSADEVEQLIYAKR